jgi:predicted enzyme related to lactoylglutathione lyase
MHHTIVHFEIPADQPERAVKFYRDLFGWKIEKFAGEGAPEYWLVSTVPAGESGMPTGPGVNGGLMRRKHPNHPPVNYIAVESVDEYAKKGKRLGATEVMPKTAVKGMGWFVWLKDTEGNVFALWESDGKAA